jgi:hypothetical protein
MFLDFQEINLGRTGQWRYNPMHSCPRHYVEVSDQRHVLPFTLEDRRKGEPQDRPCRKSSLDTRGCAILKSLLNYESVHYTITASKTEHDLY